MVREMYRAAIMYLNPVLVDPSSITRKFAERLNEAKEGDYAHSKRKIIEVSARIYTVDAYCRNLGQRVEPTRRTVHRLDKTQNVMLFLDLRTN
jgi:hypothetical protein